MLFLTSHRNNVQPTRTRPGCKRTISMAAACGFEKSESYPYADGPFGRFGYFFPDAPIPSHDAETTAALDALADAMVDKTQSDEDNSDVPAIITYLGQFIDHDITAGTDTQTDFSNIDMGDVVPKNRGEATKKIANLRTGALDLDSLYGGAAIQGKFAKEMQERLRHPTHRSKLRIGIDEPVPADAGPRPSRPRPVAEDPAHDLLRADRLIGDADPMMTAKKVADLPPDLQELLTEEGSGEINRSRAIIGDGRNDENLAVATVHLAFARLHNRVVDTLNEGTADDRYAEARKQVRWIYQWLLVNVYLPAICDETVLADVIREGATLYGKFLGRVRHEKGHMPLPMEFSVSAFRFGHSAARPDYDWNGNFGRALPDGTPLQDRAGFRDLFAFTGNGKMDNRTTRLPSNWLVNAPRFLNENKDDDEDVHPDRNTRLIDTLLAPDLHNMKNEAGGLKNVLKVLPRRNLRRGHLLSIPSAQACLEGLKAQNIAISPLEEHELNDDSRGVATPKRFINETPLWFYVLKEAEMRGKGLRLGPLGTRLVAETLFGLVLYGPDTYLAESGSANGTWHPKDGARPGGIVVDSLSALMRAALMA